MAGMIEVDVEVESGDTEPMVVKAGNERQLTRGSHLKYIVWRDITATIKNSCNIALALETVKHTHTKPDVKEKRR